MDEKQFNELMAKMNLITRLLTLNLVKDEKVQKSKIIALSNLGLNPSEIADILSTTSNTVRVALSRHKKRKKKQVEGKSMEGEDAGN